MSRDTSALSPETHVVSQTPPPPPQSALSLICWHFASRVTARQGARSRQRTSANASSGRGPFPRHSPRTGWRLPQPLASALGRVVVVSGHGDTGTSHHDAKASAMRCEGRGAPSAECCVACIGAADVGTASPCMRRQQISEHPRQTRASLSARRLPKSGGRPYPSAPPGRSYRRRSERFRAAPGPLIVVDSSGASPAAPHEPIAWEAKRAQAKNLAHAVCSTRLGGRPGGRSGVHVRGVTCGEEQPPSRRTKRPCPPRPPNLRSWTAPPQRSA